jgi:hypothetical protein
LAIFESKLPSIEKIVILSIDVVASHSALKLSKTFRHSSHILPKNRTIGWFDGASQRNGEQSGAMGIIILDEFSVYRWTLNCGRGTNIREELLGALVFLTLAHKISITDIHILGDSKIIIDWINNIGSL